MATRTSLHFRFSLFSWLVLCLLVMEDELDSLFLPREPFQLRPAAYRECLPAVPSFDFVVTSASISPAVQPIAPVDSAVPGYPSELQTGS